MALYDDHLKKKISELPSSPGVYQYFDSSGVIIYIGKSIRPNLLSETVSASSGESTWLTSSSEKETGWSKMSDFVNCLFSTVYDLRS